MFILNILLHKVYTYMAAIYWWIYIVYFNLYFTPLPIFFTTGLALVVNFDSKGLRSRVEWGAPCKTTGFERIYARGSPAFSLGPESRSLSTFSAPNTYPWTLAFPESFLGKRWLVPKYFLWIPSGMFPHGVKGTWFNTTSRRHKFAR